MVRGRSRIASRGLTITEFDVPKFEFVDWDAGRLRVNVRHVDVFRAHGWTTFEALHRCDGGDLARRIASRITTRVVLDDAAGSHAFYLKRHGAATFGEYLRPIIHGRWPIVGAVNEFEAILHFHRVGIPTMEPVALGVSGRRSLIVTKSLEGYVSLLDWLRAQSSRDSKPDPTVIRRLISNVAAIARSMHGAGLHHQDFYLNHLLIPAVDGPGDIRVIDLGRVRFRERLGERWIIKDLAQLDYSSRLLSCSDRLRFLRAYLDRPLTQHDRSLVRRISRKSRAIDRHTQKHRL
jgi:heptose I phosphotransferase